MTHPTTPDDDMDDISADLNALSARYHADSKDVVPPKHLDAQLLAAAHRAVEARPHVAGATGRSSSIFMRRMRAPLGLAASIVAVASVSIALWKESPEKLDIPSDHAPIVTHPGSALQKGAEPAGENPAPKAPMAPIAAASPPAPGAAPSPAPLVATAPLALPPASASRHINAERKKTESKPAASAASPGGNSSDLSEFAEGKPATRNLAGNIQAKSATPEARDQALDRVTVTGSNLKRADTETPSPVQVITPDLQPPAAAASDAATRVAAPAASPPTPSAPVASAPVASAPVAPAAPASIVMPSPMPPRMSAPMAATMPAAPVMAAPPPAPMPPPPPAPMPAPTPPALASQQDYAPTAPVAAAQAAPTAAPTAAAPSVAPDVAAQAPKPLEQGASSLIAALQTAADAKDATAARLVLETLKKKYPHTPIPSKLRAQLRLLGITSSQTH